jgi:hypothetical protein
MERKGGVDGMERGLEQLKGSPAQCHEEHWHGHDGVDLVVLLRSFKMVLA